MSSSRVLIKFISLKFSPKLCLSKSQNVWSITPNYLHGINVYVTSNLTGNYSSFNIRLQIQCWFVWYTRTFNIQVYHRINLEISDTTTVFVSVYFKVITEWLMAPETFLHLLHIYSTYAKIVLKYFNLVCSFSNNN